MKKINKWTWAAVLAIVLPFVFLSCSDSKDDENEESDYAAMLVGSWSDEGHDKWADDGYGDAYGFEFTKSGSCIVHGSIYGYGTYVLYDDTLIISYNSNFGTYTEKYLIKELTNKKLVLMDMDYLGSSYIDYETYYRVK